MAFGFLHEQILHGFYLNVYWGCDYLKEDFFRCGYFWIENLNLFNKIKELQDKCLSLPLAPCPNCWGIRNGLSSIGARVLMGYLSFAFVTVDEQDAENNYSHTDDHLDGDKLV